MAINTKVVMSDANVDLMTQAVIISGNSFNKVDAYVTRKEDALASSISFTVFSRMGLATTPLTDGTEATSTAMSTTEILLEPKEYGNPITTTKLANLATAGKADLAAAELVGVNAGETTDKLGLLALEASTNTIAVSTPNVLSAVDLRNAYAELATAGIQKFSDGRYVAFINPTQVSGLKDEFINIMQNTDAMSSTSGMVGALEGFTIIEDSNVTSGIVHCFGYNGLGKAISMDTELVITDATDNLNRLASIGWLAVIEYGIIDANAVRKITGAV